MWDGAEDKKTFWAGSASKMWGYSLRSLNALTFMRQNHPTEGLVFIFPPKKKKEKREKEKKRKKKKDSHINNRELKQVGNPNFQPQMNFFSHYDVRITNALFWHFLVPFISEAEKTFNLKRTQK